MFSIHLYSKMSDISLIKTFYFGSHDYQTQNVDSVMFFIFNNLPIDSSGKLTYICTFEVGSFYRAIIQPYSNHSYGSAIVFSYALPEILYYQKHNGILKKYTTQWTNTVIQ